LLLISHFHRFSVFHGVLCLVPFAPCRLKFAKHEEVVGFGRVGSAKENDLMVGLSTDDNK
jgi:hypothetical protein